ncbi:uncharacterized protein TNCV_1068561 [Trichonephila clavipes]|nr:uncharacterized protein TNCV_1068561 [Trichonephila clavipes]
MKRVEIALQMNPLPHLCRDTIIVLPWIQKEPITCLKSFVANRVPTIQYLTNADQWHHVSLEQSPTDLVSRGLDPSSLHNSLWWNGPTFLATKDFQGIFKCNKLHIYD